MDTRPAFFSHRSFCGGCLTLLLGAGVPAPLPAHAAPEAAPPPASSPSSTNGWRLLFDGRTSRGWRGFRQSSFPERGWKIEDGTLRKVAGVRGGDLVSEDTFEEFELCWEWRIPAGANSGVKYFILEERGAPVGHEYQMIDDTTVREGKQKTGSFYGVVPPRPDHPAPRIGEWNESRIVVRGQQVEHWLNGVKVLDYELGSPAVLDGVARSKFKDVAGFGTRVKGRILLTDHNDEAWFRNLRIRVPQPGNPVLGP